MQPRSPLEPSRDLERTNRDIGDPRATEPAAKAPPANLYLGVEQELDRIQPHAVINPRGWAPVPVHEAEPGRKGASGSGQVAPERARADIPRRPKRTQEIPHAIGLKTRPEEQRLLVAVGKFRVVAVADFVNEIYKGRQPQLRRDLTFLKQNGLIETHFINRRRDGRSEAVRRFEVVTLTKAAQRLLAKSGLVPGGQRIYSGLVKPREVEHDSQIYRAYLKEAAAIEAAGGRNLRVKLDFELKARLNRAVYLAKKAHPGKAENDIKAEVAHEFNLTVMNNKVVVPDLRIEYELPSGGSAQVDVEVATSAYRHSHIAHKVQAGFRMYVSNGDIGRLGAAIRDDHDLMSEILDI